MNSILPPIPPSSALTYANSLEMSAGMVALKADGAVYYARDISQRLAFIRTRPVWELMGRAHLAEAEAKLVAALEIVRQISDAYDALPAGSHYLEAAE